jgi:anthranilate 1,2-dioxygenase small subunit
VFRIAQDGDTVTFATGRYLDQIVREGDTLRFNSRRVVLDSRRVDILLVLPL